MTKYEFERELKRGIKSLPAGEAKKAIDYYSELFEDKIERGMSESAIIGEFGSPVEIADRLVQEFGGDGRESRKQSVESEAYYESQAKTAQAAMPTESRVSGGRLAVFIVLAVLLGGAFIGIAVGLWSCLIALIASGGACIIAGSVSIIPSIMELIASPAVMWVQIGICVAAIGLGILLIAITIKLIKLSVFLTKKMFGCFKNFLVVKRPIA